MPTTASSGHGPSSRRGRPAWQAASVTPSSSNLSARNTRSSARPRRWGYSPVNDTDFAPPDTPTAAEQFDALKKGLGRALQWAAAGKLDLDLLLEACLHDLRYDHQIESARSP